MLRRPKKQYKTRIAQTLVEYTFVFASIVAVLVAMSPLFKRGIQAVVHLTADQIGNQLNADQDFDTGHLQASYVNTRASMQKDVVEFAGSTNYIFDDVTRTDTASAFNLGFTPN